MVAQGQPPEVTSAEFWLGPSAGSFVASAAQLEALAGLIIGMLGGQAAVEAALATSWPAPTGELSRLANVPHMLWMASTAGMLSAGAAQILTTAEAFEASRMATATPFEVGENQMEHGVLNATNFLGMNTPAIVGNRVNYGRMWVTGIGNKAAYAAASAGGVQAIPPIPPPPPITNPAQGVGGAPEDKALDGLSSVGGAPMDMMQSVLPMVMGLPQQAGQLLSGGGPFQSLTQLPQQALSQLSSMSSQFGGASPDSLWEGGGDNGGTDWVTGTPQAGGPVAASLTGGGSGMGGVGTAGTAAALRSPLSWSSTVNAATSPVSASDSGAVSRLAEARAATTAPASSAGMGRGGMMMGPLAHAAAGQNSEKQSSPGEVADKVMVRAAAAFRSPEGVATITGFGGIADASDREGAA